MIKSNWINWFLTLITVICEICIAFVVAILWLIFKDNEYIYALISCIFFLFLTLVIVFFIWTCKLVRNNIKIDF